MVVEGRIHKMESGYGITKGIYNKSENKALQYSSEARMTICK